MYSLITFVCFYFIRLSYAADVASNAITNCTAAGSIVLDDGELIYVVDAWNSTKEGFQCITVNPDASSWVATWQWPSDRSAVHSFPHVRFPQPGILPIALNNITRMTLSATWDVAASAADMDKTTGMVADISWDFFADTDPTKAPDNIHAAFEVMIWLGYYGGAAPIGYYQNECPGVTESVGGSVYTLYCGPSWRPTRKTFTWATTDNLTTTNYDFFPLWESLVTQNFLPSNVYIGDVGFGIEAFYAPDNVTFSVSNYGAIIQPSSTPTPTPHPSASSTSSTGAKPSSSSSSSSSSGRSLTWGVGSVSFSIFAVQFIITILML